MIVAMVFSLVVINNPDLAFRKTWNIILSDRKVKKMRTKHNDNVRELCAQVRVGMSRADVEELLGQPRGKVSLEEDCYAYMEDPPTFWGETLYFCGSVEITYVDDVVTKKRMNPQCSSGPVNPVGQSAQR